MGIPKTDLTGKKIGELHVIEYIGKGKWECKCSCGKTINVDTGKLANMLVTSCGHDKSHSTKFIDMTGKTVGEWSVKKYLGNQKYLCECSCGNTKIVDGRTLRCGASTECGHSRKNLNIDITGKKFGYWEVKEYIGDQKYLCECKCGTQKILNGRTLRRGNSRSCGCMKHKIFEDTMMNRYGDTSSRRVINPRKLWQIEAIKSRELMLNYINMFHNKPTIYELSEGLDLIEAMVLRYVHKYELENFVDLNPNKSKYEDALAKLVRGIAENYMVYERDTSLLNGKELDVYIPELGLAIEFNGTYWHSSKHKSSTYHVDKSMQCGKAGVRLVHIFEYEWDNDTQREKIKYFLSDLINKDKRKVYGRETTVNIITDSEAAEFLNKYHLQGNAGASIKYGCYINNELLGVMTFGKPRFNKDFEYELIRMCWKPGCIVIGGTEKLFNRFIRDYDPNNIICYCDATKFVGSSYKKLGFKVDGLTTPNYVWVGGHNKEVLPRYRTMKQKLLDEGLGEYGETEDEIMENLGYLKIYDCGNIRYIWNK